MEIIKYETYGKKTWSSRKSSEGSLNKYRKNEEAKGWTCEENEVGKWKIYKRKGRIAEIINSTKKIKNITGCCCF